MYVDCFRSAIRRTLISYRVSSTDINSVHIKKPAFPFPFVPNKKRMSILQLVLVSSSTSASAISRSLESIRQPSVRPVVLPESSLVFILWLFVRHSQRPSPPRPVLLWFARECSECRDGSVGRSGRGHGSEVVEALASGGGEGGGRVVRDGRDGILRLLLRGRSVVLVLRAEGGGGSLALEGRVGAVVGCLLRVEGARRRVGLLAGSVGVVATVGLVHAGEALLLLGGESSEVLTVAVRDPAGDGVPSIVGEAVESTVGVDLGCVLVLRLGDGRTAA